MDGDNKIRGVPRVPPSPPASPPHLKRDLSASSSSTSSDIDEKDKRKAKNGDTKGSSTSTADKARSTLDERAEVRDLVSSMRLQASLLGTAFDALGEEFQKAALLAQAIAAAEQISRIKTELEEREDERQRKIKELTEELRARVRQHIKDILMQKADAIIQDIIRKDLKEKVANEIAVQVPASLKAQITESQHVLWDVEAELHNLDLKHYHSAIRSPSDPHPLRAPLPRLKVSSTAPSPASPSGGGGGGAVPPTPMSQRTNSSSTIGASVDSALVEPPAPSPLFPTKVKSLVRLKLEEARNIVDYYDLEVPGEQQPTREQYLNAILSHIGVPFKFMDAPAHSKARRRSTNPIMTNISPVNSVRSALV